MFDKYLYPDYTNRKALDQKSFPSNDALIYVFSQEEVEEEFEHLYPMIRLDASAKKKILENLIKNFGANKICNSNSNSHHDNDSGRQKHKRKQKHVYGSGNDGKDNYYHNHNHRKKGSRS